MSFDYILFPGPINSFRLEITDNGRPAQAASDRTIAVTNASGQAAVLVAGTVAIYVAPETPMWVEPIDLSRDAAVTVWEDRRDGTAVQVGQVSVSIGEAGEGGYELTPDGQVDIRSERGRRTRRCT